MAVVIPVFPTLVPFTSIFDESAKFRSVVDRMWQEMHDDVFSNWQRIVNAEEQQKTEDSQLKQERTKEPTEVAQQDKSSKPLVVANDGSFQLSLPVSSFKPEELTVKVVGDSLLVEAHHEEKDEESGSFSRRHFEQRFLLPKSCDKEALSSSLSAEGVLTICAPSKAIAAAPSERKIEIQTLKPKL